MERLRVRSLQWAVGAFFGTIGALMLIAPHQFSFVEYATLLGHLFTWGLLFLSAGIGLIAVATLVLPRWLIASIHLLGAVLLIGLTASFTDTGEWIGPFNYSLLAAGLLAATRLPRAWRRDLLPAQADLFALLIGLSTFLTGLLLLLARIDPQRNPVYARSPADQTAFGVAFLLIGLWCFAAELRKLQMGQAPPRWPAWVRLANPWAYLATSAVFLFCLL
jgi:hypothetical protein